MAKAQNPQHYPFMSLESLTLRGQKGLDRLSNQLRHLTSLGELKITDFNGFEVLPEWLVNLSSLESLTLLHCSNLTSLPSPEEFQLLKKLLYLEISECPRALEKRGKEGGEEWYKIAHIPTLTISAKEGILLILEQ